MNLINLSTENNLYDFHYLDSFEKGFGLLLSQISPSIESDFYLITKLQKSYYFVGAMDFSPFFKNALVQYESLIIEKMHIDLSKIEFHDKISEFIISEIRKNKSCLAVIDLCDLYYSPCYKKEHLPYFLIINGFDKDTGLFSIVDTQQTIVTGKTPGLIYEPFLIPVNMVDDMAKSVNNRYSFRHFYSLPSERIIYKSSSFKDVLKTYLNDITNSCHKEQELIQHTHDYIKNISENDSIINSYIDEFEFKFKNLINHKYIFFEEIKKKIVEYNFDSCMIDQYVNNVLSELEKIKKTVVISTKKRMTGKFDNNFNQIQAIEKRIKDQIEVFENKIINSSNAQQHFFKNLNNNKVNDDNVNKKTSNGILLRSNVEITLRSIIEKNTSIEDFSMSSTLNSLGVNSIMAIKIMHEIYKNFQKEVPLHFFLNNCKLSDIISFLEESSGKDMQTISQLTKSKKRKYYPLGQYQKNLIMYTSKLYGDGLAYNITIVLDKKGKFNKERLANSFNQVIKKHEAFRMNFYSIQNDDYLVVHDNVNFRLEHVVIDYCKREHFFANWIKPFNLEESILIRACLIEYNDKQTASLIVDIHHIIADGGSINIFFRELACFYNEEEKDTSNHVDFTDFIIWENELSQVLFYAKQQKFWENYYLDGMPKLKLPIDNPNISPNEIGYESVLVDYMYSESFNKHLLGFNKAYGYTHYMTLLSVINILLYKYTEQTDLIVWTPMANRQIAEQINMVGMFVNTVPIRNKIDHRITFLDFLKLVKTNCVNVFTNTSLDINKLKHKLKINDNENLYQMIFIYQNYESNLLKFDQETITPFRINQNVVRFNLLIEAYENNEQTKIVVKYKSQLFRRETIDKLVFQIESLTLKLINNPDIMISEIAI